MPYLHEDGYAIYFNSARGFGVNYRVESGAFKSKKGWAPTFSWALARARYLIVAEAGRIERQRRKSDRLQRRSDLIARHVKVMQRGQ